MRAPALLAVPLLVGLAALAADDGPVLPGSGPTRGPADPAPPRGGPATAAPEAGADEAPPAMPDGDPVRGEELARGSCAGCHGFDGNTPVGNWPRLAGQLAEHTFKQLQDYRDGRRDDPMMSPPVEGMSDQDFADLAAWYAGQEIQPGPQDPSAAEAGRALYFEGRPGDHVPPCVGCHGPRGRGWPGIIPGGFPLVVGQNAEYTIKTMTDYREGRRTNDHNRMMQAATARMSDEDIAAVAWFIADFF